MKVRGTTLRGKLTVLCWGGADPARPDDAGRVHLGVVHDRAHRLLAVGNRQRLGDRDGFRFRG